MSRCEKTRPARRVFRKTYWFDGLCKSFHDRPFHELTSSIPALCLDQDVLDRAMRISHRPREVR
uniref:Uncharacterized protein n=1 Tax=Vibrio sp. VT3(2010) TaxID=795726 RepID=E9KL80_9VIBR|nr:hypothetical protein [Vibrio sp. VT3(2010)]